MVMTFQKRAGLNSKKKHLVIHGINVWKHILSKMAAWKVSSVNSMMTLCIQLILLQPCTALKSQSTSKRMEIGGNPSRNLSIHSDKQPFTASSNSFLNFRQIKQISIFEN